MNSGNSTLFIYMLFIFNPREKRHTKKKKTLVQDIKVKKIQKNHLSPHFMFFPLLSCHFPGPTGATTVSGCLYAIPISGFRKVLDVLLDGSSAGLGLPSPTSCI